MQESYNFAVSGRILRDADGIVHRFKEPQVDDCFTLASQDELLQAERGMIYWASFSFTIPFAGDDRALKDYLKQTDEKLVKAIFGIGNGKDRYLVPSSRFQLEESNGSIKGYEMVVVCDKIRDPRAIPCQGEMFSGYVNPGDRRLYNLSQVDQLIGLVDKYGGNIGTLLGEGNYQMDDPTGQGQSLIRRIKIRNRIGNSGLSKRARRFAAGGPEAIARINKLLRRETSLEDELDKGEWSSAEEAMEEFTRWLLGEEEN